jgi:hypothetical protein
MRRFVLVLGLATMSLVFASQAAASTTTAITMKFNEPVSPSFKTCPVFPGGLCGSGLVKPFGQATETIQFGAGIDCLANTGSPTCDLRTIFLPGGSFMSDEISPSVGTPCPAENRPIPGSPCIANLSDTIIGGDGSFFEASGSFTGTVRSGGLANSLQFSGSITVP